MGFVRGLLTNKWECVGYVINKIVLTSFYLRILIAVVFPYTKTEKFRVLVVSLCIIVIAFIRLEKYVLGQKKLFPTEFRIVLFFCEETATIVHDCLPVK